MHKLLQISVIYFFIFILFITPTTYARTLEGIVKTVNDGDTIVLITANTSKLKIRLYGIDAPETKKPKQPGQPYGDLAKRALIYKIAGRNISAEIMATDQYQRSVAVIRYNNRDINREMVSEGVAWAYRNYLHGAYASEYIDAEQQARSKRLGLWRDSNPQPPWEYRRSYKKGGAKKHSWWW